MPNVASSQSGLRKPNNHTTKLNRAVVTINAWKRDDRGNVAMLFGLSLGAMIMMVGGAVDIGRWLNARDQTQSSMDAAVLAGARVLQLGGTNAELNALSMARNTYKSNTKKRINVFKDTVDFQLTDNGMGLKAKGNVEIRTPFLQFIRIGKLPVFAPSEAVPEATTAQDRFEGVNREVMMMLDVSGSMCSPCSKRDAMRNAAKDLVDTMMRNNGLTEYTTRMGIVPFSADVRPPQTWLATVTDPTRPNSISLSYKSGKKWYSRTYYKSRCVGERTGVQKYTNAAPGPGAYVLAAYEDSGSSNNYCTISSNGTVVPLTTDKEMLKSKIGALTTGGGTAGHVGTAWAYYMLSPTWNSVLPTASQPAAFGTEKLKKIAILLTDGEYNSPRDANGVITGSDGAGSNANGKTSSQQAVEICKKMHDDDIEVYTIGFDLGDNQTAINTLAACASSESNAYLAENTASLQTVFRDISIKLTDLHLVK